MPRPAVVLAVLWTLPGVGVARVDALAQRAVEARSPEGPGRGHVFEQPRAVVGSGWLIEHRVRLTPQRVQVPVSAKVTEIFSPGSIVPSALTTQMS